MQNSKQAFTAGQSAHLTYSLKRLVVFAMKNEKDCTFFKEKT
ncbi:hypothetical protein [Brevundimonas vesicularis]